MSNQVKAFLIAVPVAVAIQAALILLAIAMFGEAANIQPLAPIGVVTGLVAYFSIRKHLDARN